MKTKSIFSTLIIIVSACFLMAFNFQEKGKIYFIRSTNSTGSLVPYKVYIDDQLVCNLKNKRYSVHEVSPGEHFVSIKNTGLLSRDKSRPLKINVVSGKNNYLIVVNATNIYLQEAVESSAQELLKRVLETTNCLPAQKAK